MNEYLRTVGFAKYQTTSHIKFLSRTVIDAPDSKCIMSNSLTNAYIEYYKQYSDDFGLSIKGYVNEIDDLLPEKLVPFVFTKNKLSIKSINQNENNYLDIFECESISDCMINCTESKSNTKFSFYLHNIVDYFNNKNNMTLPKINVVGLSNYGKIILPTKYSIQNSDQSNCDVRKKISGYKLNTLDLKSISIKNDDTIKACLKQEDFLTLVDGYFVEISKACYCILGDIVKIKKIKNKVTLEDSYMFKLNVSDLNIEVCINAKDVIGMPSVGMRFMGHCFFQGKILY